MRSSIACARCRRSKVKCVNLGVHTTCKACESGGRECVYPVPGGGAGGVQQQVLTVGTIPLGDAGNLGGGLSNNSNNNNNQYPSRPRPKKPSTGGPSTGLPSAPITSFNGEAPSIYGALVDSAGIPSADDVLADANLTWQFWTNMHDHYKHHFSAELPFIHAPTFLSPTRLPKLPSQHQLRSPPSPDDKTSYPLCLGILTLMGRFYPPLVKLHSSHAASVTKPVAGKNQGQTTVSEGRRVGEFYAAVLRRHLFGSSGRDVEVGQPTVEKVQALVMLAVHEWLGEGRAERASVWVGLAGRMANLLRIGRAPLPCPTSDSAVEEDDGDVAMANGGNLDVSRKRRKVSQLGGGVVGQLAGGDEKEKKELVIQEEIARRTFWSVFMLERALSRGNRKELIWRLEDVNGTAAASTADAYEYPEDEYDEPIRLPCSDQSFLFGQKVRTDVLHLTPPSSSSPTAEDAGSPSDIPAQIGEREGDLSRIIRGMEIWGRVRRFRPSSPNNLSTAFPILQQLITSFSAPLPPNLTFTPDNLNAHIHSNSSTSYAIIHVINFLCRMVLHRAHLPFLPSSSTPPTPETLASASDAFRSARGVLDLVKGLTDWNVGVETPLVATAVQVAGVWAVYAAAHPHLDPTHALTDPAFRPEDDSISTHVATAISQLKRFSARWAPGGGRWADSLLRLAEFYRRARRNPTETISSVERRRFERMFEELGRDTEEDSVTAGGETQEIPASSPPPPSRVVKEVKRPSPTPPTTQAKGWAAVNKSSPVAAPVAPMLGHALPAPPPPVVYPAIQLLTTTAPAPPIARIASPPPPPPPAGSHLSPGRKRTAGEMELDTRAISPIPSLTASVAPVAPVVPNVNGVGLVVADAEKASEVKSEGGDVDAEGEVEDDGEGEDMEEGEGVKEESMGDRDAEGEEDDDGWPQTGGAGAEEA